MSKCGTEPINIFFRETSIVKEDEKGKYKVVKMSYSFPNYEIEPFMDYPLGNVRECEGELKKYIKMKSKK